MQEILDYYRRHSHVTDPRQYEGYLAELPESVPDLVSLVQGLVIDKDFLGLYDVKAAEGRPAEADTRYFHAIVSRGPRRIRRFGLPLSVR
jgi:hypothetical protein